MKTRKIASTVVALVATATFAGASEEVPGARPGAPRLSPAPADAAASAALTAEDGSGGRPVTATLAEEQPVADEPACAERDLCVGLRVRLRPQPGAGQPLIGDVVAMDAESIAVRPAREPEPRVVRVSRASLARIDALRGRRSGAGTGALIGFIPGALLGGLFVGGLQGNDDLAGGDAGEIARGALLFGGAGALLGLLIGSASSGDRWEELPAVRWKPRVSIAPSRHGMRLAFSVRF